MALEEGTVPPAVLMDTMSYYDNDDTVRMCDNFLEQRVFNMVPRALAEMDMSGGGGGSEFKKPPRKEAGGDDGDTNATVPAWYVEWTLGPGAAPVYPALFNSAGFLEKVAVFLKRARVYVRAFGFVAIWHVKDVAGWLRRYLAAATSPAERNAIGLPFGVLEAHKFELRAHANPRDPFMHQLEAVPLDEAAFGRNIAVAVYNHSLQLVPALLTRVHGALLHLEENYGTAARSVTSAQGSGGGSEGGGSAARLLMPRSVFYDLHDMKRLLNEALVNRMDADFNVAHPRVILQTQTPPNLALAADNLADRDMYETEDVMEAATLQLMRTQRYTLSEAKRHIDRLKERTGGGVVAGAGGLTPREMRRRHFGRPDPMEDAHTFPEFIQVAQAATATVINDYDYQQHVYFEKVRQHMGLSSDTLIGEGGAAIKNYRRSKSNNKERAASLAVGAGGDDASDKVEKIVARERDIYVAIFDFVYATVLTPYDWAAVSETAEMVDAILVAADAAEAGTDTSESAAHDAGSDDPATAAAHILGQIKEEEKEAHAKGANKKTKMATDEEAQSPPPSKKRKRAAAAEEDLTEGKATLRVVVKELRKYLARTHQQQHSFARLVFEPNHERMSEVRVARLMQLYELGLVDPHVLEREIRVVDGQHIRLRDPPVEFLPGQVALLRRDLDEEEKAAEQAGRPQKRAKHS